MLLDGRYFSHDRDRIGNDQKEEQCRQTLFPCEEAGSRTGIPHAQKSFVFSALRIISDGIRRALLDSRTSVLSVGLMRPRSSMLIVVRSRPVSNANSSWERPILFRISLSTTPKAFSAPKRG